MKAHKCGIADDDGRTILLFAPRLEEAERERLGCLFAAAPDLLEVCKVLVSGDVNEAICLAEPAIAKVEGLKEEQR